MTPSKKKLLKRKEVSLDPSLKVETTIVKLPNDENKLFDENDDVGTTTIPDLSLPSEDEEEEAIFNDVWEYAMDTLFKLSPFILKGKVSESGSNIKTWRLWNSFSNGMKMKEQLENPMHSFKRNHGIKAT